MTAVVRYMTRAKGVQVAVLLVAAAGSAPTAGHGDGLQAALEHYRASRYDEALALLEVELEDAPSNGAVRVARARTLGRIGRLDEAIEDLEGLVAAAPETAGARLLLAELSRRRGRFEEAQSLLEAVLASGDDDRLEAEVRLGELLLARGDREGADARFDELIDAYNRSSSLTSRQLVAVGDACRQLGRHDPQLFKDALRAYDEAIAADRQSVEARIAVGELFLEKYNGTEARSELDAALALSPSHPEALLAMARVLGFEGSYAALEQARKALEVDPSLVAARVFVAEQLLELEDFTGAEEEVRQALAVNPRSAPAKTLLAAARYLQGDLDSFHLLEREVLEANPGYADFYNDLADAAVRNRLYREAAHFAQQAVLTDAKSWRGWGLWGLNQLRLGEIEAGRGNLEAAFAGDPYNVWIKNTLDLVDDFAEYESFGSERFELVASSDEAEVLGLYALELAEEAYDHLAERYHVRPSTPIRLEFYPSHADFSVRTIGLAGMGALGVCFGGVIAQDSPRARPRGAFNWGSTLWHELAHTFTLQISEHRVPRWLTEGLSVLEERRARPGWGDDLSIDFVVAWKRGELLPIAELNNGFVRPESPEQIGLSYYQASLVAELIEREWGFDALLALLEGYRDVVPTDTLLREVLGIELEDFDARFDDFLEERFGTAKASLGELEAEPEETEGDLPPDLFPIPIPPSPEELAERAEAHLDSFPDQLAYGSWLVDEERGLEAVPFLERARDLFPYYVGPDSPYRLLATIHRDADEPREALRELADLVAIDENDYDSRIELADLHEELEDPVSALRVLESALYVDPGDPDLHRRMADLYEETGDTRGAVRSRRALVALHLQDQAQARFELARALADDGQRRQAKLEVLRALELAPSFEAAQKLLLELAAPPSS